MIGFDIPEPRYGLWETSVNSTPRIRRPAAVLQPMWGRPARPKVRRASHAPEPSCRNPGRNKTPIDSFGGELRQRRRYTTLGTPTSVLLQPTLALQLSCPARPGDWMGIVSDMQAPARWCGGDVPKRAKNEALLVPRSIGLHAKCLKPSDMQATLNPNSPPHGRSLRVSFGSLCCLEMQ